MKKGIIVLLITVLAAGMIFADVTGSASFSAGFDLDDKVFTISNEKTGTNAFKFDFAAESNETAAVESGIYAKFDGSFEAYMTEGALKVDFKLNDATIQAVDGLWSVNLTKVANGVELTYADNALDVWFKNKLNWGVSLQSKDFTIIEGLTISGKVGYTVAKNDLTDPANYTYGFDADTLKEIEDAKNTKDYFALNDDGTYQNDGLRACQDAVAAAEKTLKEAKEKFAKDPGKANYLAIADAEDYLADAQSDLKDAESEMKTKFMDDMISKNKGWYTKSTSYVYSESWKVVNNKPTESETTKVLVEIETELEKNVPYYIIRTFDGADSNITYKYSVEKAADYTPTTGNEVVKTITATKDNCKAYLVGSRTTSYAYKENTDSYKLVENKGTATVNGGVAVAYKAEKVNASLDANVSYETIAKEFGYDITLKGGYDFVSAETAFKSGDNGLIFNASAALKLESLIGIPLTISGGAKDILSKTDDLRSYYGNLEVSVIGITAKLGGTFNTKTSKVNSRWAGNVELSYAMDVAKFTFTGALTKEAGIAEKTHNYGEKKLAFDPTFEVTNTTLIDNATLGLKWAGAHFGGDATKASLGAVTASISVKF